MHNIQHYQSLKWTCAPLGFFGAVCPLVLLALAFVLLGLGPSLVEEEEHKTIELVILSLSTLCTTISV